MLWQCRCCGFMTPDHLKISSHMKDMHSINFKPEIVTPLSEDESERLRGRFDQIFKTGSDMVKYSAITEEKGL